MPPRTARLKSKTRLKPRSAKKSANWIRAHGSVERVEWVKSLACIVCVLIHPLLGLARGGCHNCHTETGGMGRKANADRIVPMCPSHHRMYDQHQAPLDNPEIRAAIKAYAARVEEAWRAHVGQVHGTPTQRSA